MIDLSVVKVKSRLRENENKSFWNQTAYFFSFCLFYWCASSCIDRDIWFQTSFTNHCDILHQADSVYKPNSMCWHYPVLALWYFPLYIYIYTVNFCSNCVDNSSLLWVLAVLFLPFCSTIEDRFSLLPLMSTSAFGNGLWAAIKSF